MMQITTVSLTFWYTNNMMNQPLHPVTTFWLGIGLGVLLCYPYIHWLEKTPEIVGEPVSEAIYNETKTHSYTIHNIPGWFFGFPKYDLRIITAPECRVNQVHRQRYGKDAEPVYGFYTPSRHEIICVPDIETVVHEIRHEFEGNFHR